MILAATLALAQASPLASEAFMSGEELHQKCQEQIPLTCVAYVLGVSDALQDAVSHNAPRLVCFGAEVETDALLQAVIRYLRDHPETRQARAAGLVITALREAFPCSPVSAR